MKILFVSEYYPPKVMGGGELNIATVAEALVSSGANVAVLTSSHPGLVEHEEKNGVHIYRWLKTGSSPSSILSNICRSFLFPRSVMHGVKRFVKQQPVNIIHFIGASIIAAPQLKYLNIPLFATIESFPTLCPKGDRLYNGKEECPHICSLSKFVPCQQRCSEIGKLKNRWFLKYNPLFLIQVYFRYHQLNKALRHCRLIAISQYVQQLLQQQGLSSIVIPNALDLAPFTAVRKNRTANKRKANHVKKIIYLGALIHSKGPQIILDAVDDLPVRVEFYGDGPLRSQLENTIRQKNLNAMIYPFVPYDQVPQLYASADIVAFPSLWPEPFGRIAIEAMAAGKPVIGSDTGAIRELVAAGAGTLLDPGDVNQLRRSIIQLLDDKKIRMKMGRKGREASKEYDAGITIRKIESTYLDEIKKKESNNNG